MRSVQRYIKALKRYCTDENFRFNVNVALGKYDWLPDEAFLRKNFRAVFGRELNLDDPRTYCEKMQWLKLYNRDPAYHIMADKVRVRDHIASTIGAEYLVPLLGVWDDPNDIDFDTLPDRFVLKCNHNSGLGMYICKDKSRMDRNKVIQDLQKGLKENYYLHGREWPYRDIPRKVLCEQYLAGKNDEPPNDYKVLCFNGEAKLIEIHQGRFSGRHYQNFYDREWNRTEIAEIGLDLSPDPIEKPENFDEMMRLSEALANGIPHVRVDWYSIDGKLYFGEMTFFDSSGFFVFADNRHDELLGSWIDLPEKRTSGL